MKPIVWMVRKGQAVPYPNGTEIERKADGVKAVILRECYCTGEWLHYEVSFNGKIVICQHPEIERLFDVVNKHQTGFLSRTGPSNS